MTTALPLPGLDPKPTVEPAEPATAWALDVFVPGRPAPQGSKRGYIRSGKVVQVEMSPHVATWREDVRAACLTAWHGQPPIDAAIVLDVEFVRPRPKTAPKTFTRPATSAPDLSKLVRSTEDAITSAGVWVDDSRVVDTRARKRTAEPGETPGAHIRIAVLPTRRPR